MAVVPDRAEARTVPDFDDFFRREYPALAVLATAISGDPGTGEDIAQEALHRAQRRWPTVSAYDKPGAWARRVTINLATSRRRRLGAEARALLRLGGTGNRVGPSAESAALLNDPEVWRAVADLPPRQRSVVALHYLEDRPVAEIADLLGISVSATTSSLAKARQRLAETLAPLPTTSPEGDLR